MAQSRSNRRELIRDLGIGAAAIPFILNLPSLGFANQQRRKQRLVILFSPNGVVPSTFWPDEQGPSFTFKESLKPLEPFKNRTLILHGVSDKVRGDGDNHMRGMGCLLTGTELFPGNIQGGSDTPAGWASGISIDQEIKTFLQKDPANRSQLGDASLFYLALSQAGLTQTDQSLATLDRLFTAYPQSKLLPAGFFMSAQILLDAGRTEAARTRLEKLLRDYPNDPLIKRAKKVLSDI